jgi:hypothetical protein
MFPEHTYFCFANNPAFAKFGELSLYMRHLLQEVHLLDALPHSCAYFGEKCLSLVLSDHSHELKPIKHYRILDDVFCIILKSQTRVH